MEDTNQTLTEKEHGEAVAATWIATDFGNVGIVGWIEFDRETTTAIMEAMLFEGLDKKAKAARDEQDAKLDDCLESFGCA